MVKKHDQNIIGEKNRLTIFGLTSIFMTGFNYSVTILYILFMTDYNIIQ